MQNRQPRNLWIAIPALIALGLLVWPMLSTLHLGLAVLLKALAPT